MRIKNSTMSFRSTPGDTFECAVQLHPTHSTPKVELGYTYTQEDALTVS